MNKDTAKDYLPLVQALAEGKTIQKFSDGDGWEEVVSPNFASPAKLYRIKPEPTNDWYRVGLFNGKRTESANSSRDELEFEADTNFVEWITDRIEYTIP